MSYSFNDIAYFLEVVRQGHLGRAAESIGVTQPTISKALRRLEEAVGMPLLERSSHGTRLTGNGELFVESARRFHAQHVEMARVATEIRAQHQGLLRIGLTNSAGDTDAVRALADMVCSRPGLRIRLTIGKSDALNDEVEQGALDLAVVPSYPGANFSCTHARIGEDKVQVAARTRHPLFQRATVTLADLSAYPWILASRASAARRLVTEIFEREGVPPPQVALEADYTSGTAMGLLASTDLLALVPGSMLRGWAAQVAPLPVPQLAFQRTLVLLAQPRASWSPLMTTFRDLLLAGRS
ncbi:Galactose-binding protein regulator [Variovorax sp. SRS16]|uniref:LysR family transcriptional regulator n=1 Tax=Variovorax sp. SRS16 TaxID=282217 RepID=UPI0013169A9D|nr:LysR family transcriptional regulator [Variovorax sp. SRS16]VTU23821.1 Galactose-binding protein regulator [Variovorax sp. SRS16]